jgi:hypothetical protein
MAEETTETWEGSSPWLFLLGALIFLGSAVLFIYDLLLNNDILRGIVGNALGAVLLMAWAAHDTLYDPNSAVATRGGAIGTALLLYGLYLIGAGIVILVTGFVRHGRLVLGVAYVGLALAAILVGFLIFPTEAVIEEKSGEGSDATGESDGEEPADSGPATEMDSNPDTNAGAEPIENTGDHDEPESEG